MIGGKTFLGFAFLRFEWGFGPFGACTSKEMSFLWLSIVKVDFEIGNNVTVRAKALCFLFDLGGVCPCRRVKRNRVSIAVVSESSIRNIDVGRKNFFLCYFGSFLLFFSGLG